MSGRRILLDSCHLLFDRKEKMLLNARRNIEKAALHRCLIISSFFFGATTAQPLEVSVHLRDSRFNYTQSNDDENDDARCR